MKLRNQNQSKEEQNYRGRTKYTVLLYFLGDNEVTHLININCQRCAVGKTIPVTACRANIEVPRLAASCKEAYLSHKTHISTKTQDKFRGVLRTYSTAKLARHLTKNTNIQSPVIECFAVAPLKQKMMTHFLLITSRYEKPRARDSNLNFLSTERYFL